MHHNSNQQGSDMNIKQIFAKSLRTLLCCVSAILLAGCFSSPKENACMDRAESLMESAPDSAMTILDSISLGSLSSQKDKARYALLKSMVLDTNYIDATSFDILQPAIDYYLKKGSPDEKLRTLYYQGRIYQNRKEDEEAMRCFINALDHHKEISDSLTLGRLYVAQSLIFDKQSMHSSYIRTALAAAKIFEKYGKKDVELDCISNAINGYICENMKAGADSLIPYAKSLAKEIGAVSVPWIHASIMYSLDYIPERITTMLLDSIGIKVIGNLGDREAFEEITLDLAYGYEKLGNIDRAWDYLCKLDSVDDSRILKYLVIKASITEAQKKFPETVETLRKTIDESENLFNEILSQEIESVEKRHLLETEKLLERKRRQESFFIGVVIVLLLVILSLTLFKKIRLAKDKNQMLSYENSRLEEYSSHMRSENSRLVKENDHIEELNLRIKEEKNKLRDENCQLLKKNNILKSTSQRLCEEKEEAEREREKYLAEFGRMTEETEKIREERDNLMNILAVQHKLSESLKNINKENTILIASYFASKIPYADKQSRTFKKLDKTISENKDKFLAELQNLMETSFPEFMANIRKCGLSTVEVHFVCLYALGLNGKEIGTFMNTSRHYIVSSEIRKKLNLDSAHPNIGQYVMSQIV